MWCVLGTIIKCKSNKNYILSECVFVALGIRRAKRMCHLSSVACPATQHTMFEEKVIG